MVFRSNVANHRVMLRGLKHDDVAACGEVTLRSVHDRRKVTKARQSGDAIRLCVFEFCKRSELRRVFAQLAVDEGGGKTQPL
jgi:hypothetical protein